MRKQNNTSPSLSRTVTFKHQIKVSARYADFEPLSTLQFLDLTRLARGKHQIHVGFISGSCGKRAVSARIVNGMIGSFEVESCADTSPASPELTQLFRSALAKLKPPKGAPRLPLPVADFVEARMGIGWLFPCAWVIAFGYIFGCCLKKTKRDGKETVIIECNLLDFPPKME